MPFDIKTEVDLASVEARARSMKSSGQPAVLNVADLMALEAAPPAMLIDGLLPGSGASLMFGAPKSNKTLLAVQMAIAVASGNPVFDCYRALTPGPVLLVKQDDPPGLQNWTVTRRNVWYAFAAAIWRTPRWFCDFARRLWTTSMC